MRSSCVHHSSWFKSKDKSQSNRLHRAEQEENVAVFGDSDLREVVVISGPVFSEVSVVFESGKISLIVLKALNYGSARPFQMHGRY